MTYRRLVVLCLCVHRNAELKAKFDANDITLHAEQRRRGVISHLISTSSSATEYPALLVARQLARQQPEPTQSQASAAVAAEVNHDAPPMQGDESDSDYDDLLDELEQDDAEAARIQHERLAQMTAAAQQLTLLAAHGYGTHNAVHQEDVPAILKVSATAIV